MSATTQSAEKPTRVALVTGAAQGIGRAIALRLAADGLNVAVSDLPEKLDSLNAVVEEIQSLGSRAVAFVTDVAKEEEVKDMVESTVSVLGRLDVMVKQGDGGRIIGASSICGLRGYASVGGYCISKAAVRSLTQTTALELREHAITVNAYAPGVIETNMRQPADVAAVVSFLASPDSHFVTGQSGHNEMKLSKD
ncbi:hypothetical protein B0H19DRAFT_1214377 [Mycena capillaripes]|nr:hypothetical protein B0H19DRAFT_1214377 [Mycena capillaripes]